MFLLHHVHRDESAFQNFSESIFSEIDSVIVQNGIMAKILAFENGGFRLALDFTDAVDGLLRNHEVARDNNRKWVEANGMCYGAYTRAVVT